MTAGVCLRLPHLRYRSKLQRTMSANSEPLQARLTELQSSRPTKLHGTRVGMACW